ncbi:uncharacterized protein LOC8288257 [Ricinus communis]|uniref:uncharacterized protein LOC8288257 n=1 Tax=Ricinus communis TaxID=3988 RepID=UPI00201AE206|nr:uncharacterized protein LOC8288257 [Ricinus communis]
MGKSNHDFNPFLFPSTSCPPPLSLSFSSSSSSSFFSSSSSPSLNSPFQYSSPNLSLAPSQSSNFLPPYAAVVRGPCSACKIVLQNCTEKCCLATDKLLQTGLLFDTTEGDQTSADDGVSSKADDRRSESERAELLLELQSIKTENQKLRYMLNQVINNYNEIQRHLIALMSEQPQQTDTAIA